MIPEIVSPIRANWYEILRLIGFLGVGVVILFLTLLLLSKEE